MATQFAEGRYLARIVNQYFTESPQKRTPGFVLTFRIIQNLDQPDTAVKSYERDTTWWVTEKTIKRVLHDLHVLGYPGTTLAGVDPDSDDFHNFRDLEVEFVCTHETSSEDVFERWNLPNSKPRLQNKSQLQRLDRLLDPEGERVNGGPEVGDPGIDETEPPF